MRSNEHLTIIEQLHMAALATYGSNPVCIIEYMDTQGRKTVKGSVFYFTNSMVCLKDGSQIQIEQIRKVIC